jgi:hypothetical protein
MWISVYIYTQKTTTADVGINVCTHLFLAVCLSLRDKKTSSLIARSMYCLPCMYVCMYAYMYVFMRTIHELFARVPIRVYTYVCIHSNKFLCTYVYTHMCVCVCPAFKGPQDSSDTDCLLTCGSSLCAQAYRHVCIHAYIHRYIHACTPWSEPFPMPITHTFMQICTDRRMHTFARAVFHNSSQTNTYKDTPNVCVCIYIYIYIYIYIHIHTHAHNPHTLTRAAFHAHPLAEGGTHLGGPKINEGNSLRWIRYLSHSPTHHIYVCMYVCMYMGL